MLAHPHYESSLTYIFITDIEVCNNPNYLDANLKGYQGELNKNAGELQASLATGYQQLNNVYAQIKASLANLEQLQNYVQSYQQSVVLPNAPPAPPLAPIELYNQPASLPGPYPVAPSLPAIPAAAYAPAIPSPTVYAQPPANTYTPSQPLPPPLPTQYSAPAPAPYDGNNVKISYKSSEENYQSNSPAY